MEQQYAIVVGDVVDNTVDGITPEFAAEHGWIPLPRGFGRGDRYDAKAGAFSRLDAHVSLKDLQAAAVAAVNAEYDRRVLVLSSGYPLAERESWPVQTSEARALRADAKAVTPWIDAAAAARGIPRADLAARIVALDDQYRAVHGGLSGTRQRLEGEILAATTAEAVAAVAWPAEAATEGTA